MEALILGAIDYLAGDTPEEKAEMKKRKEREAEERVDAMLAEERKERKKREAEDEADRLQGRDRKAERQEYQRYLDECDRGGKRANVF